MFNKNGSRAPPMPIERDEVPPESAAERADRAGESFVDGPPRRLHIQGHRQRSGHLLE